MKQGDLLDLINWESVMLAPRWAGGHREVMDDIFDKNAYILASWQSDGYDGDLIYAYLFNDGSVALITDYFGSCSGCDSWEDASDKDAKSMITSLVSSARLFSDVYELEKFCKEMDETNQGDSGFNYDFYIAKHLLKDIHEFLPIITDIEQNPSKAIIHMKGKPVLKEFFTNLALNQKERKNK